VRALIHRGASDAEIRVQGEGAGMVPLRTDAMRWIAAGLTSQEEVLRVTRE
jgi:general secretion pathway protein E